MHESGGITFEVYANDSSHNVTTDAILAETVHMVGTYDTVTMRLFIDGEEVDNDITTIEFVDNPFELHIGRWSDGGNYFHGMIDEVAVYGRALPPSRVALHYAVGTGQGM
jgi:hypothetical protein